MGTADNTRSLIVHVFEDMLRSMPINNITVLKLMEACGLSRKSFYRYFNDIWDLILQAVEKDVFAATGKHSSELSTDDLPLFAKAFISPDKMSFYRKLHESKYRKEFRDYLYGVYRLSLHSGLIRTLAKYNKSPENYNNEIEYILTYLTAANFHSIISIITKESDINKIISPANHLNGKKMNTEILNIYVRDFL